MKSRSVKEVKKSGINCEEALRCAHHEKGLENLNIIFG